MVKSYVMKHIRHFCLLAFFALMLAQSAPVAAQRVTDSGYRTVAHIKSDGTIQDASFRVIGHAEGVPRKWAAYYFFFSR